MKRITPEEFRQFFNENTDGDYILLSDYKTKRDKILVHHKVCDSDFEMTADHFKSGQRCPKCRYVKSVDTRKKSTGEKNLDEIKTTLGPDFEMIGEYVDYRTKIDFKHSVCDSTIKLTPLDILSRKRTCPICNVKEASEKRAKTTDAFKAEFELIANDEYELISEYVNKRTKVIVKHKKCNNEFEVRPNDLLSGSGCPICNESRGEREVRRVLDKYNVTYVSQFKFEDCKNKRALPFDFAIMKEDNVTALIEYQGIQHYKKTGYFKGEQKLKYTQRNDEIKAIYCKENNIELIIIPYWELSNIEKILTKKII